MREAQQFIMRGIHSVRNSRDLKKFLLVIPDIISESEEAAIISFLQPKLQRKRYEGDHFDGVISKYKETEMSLNNAPEAISVAIERIKGVIRETTGVHEMAMMPPHVLDLSAEGFIGAHVDSVKFSGGIIAGLSLQSTRFMRLEPDHVDDNYKNSATCISSDRTPYYSLDYSNKWREEEGVRSLSRHDPFLDTDNLFNGAIEIKLPRRSFYILSGPLRYHFTHEIFGPNKVPLLFSDTVLSERRLSVIFRDELSVLE